MNKKILNDKLIQIKKISPFAYGFLKKAVVENWSNKELKKAIIKSAKLDPSIESVWLNIFSKFAEDPVTTAAPDKVTIPGTQNEIFNAALDQIKNLTSSVIKTDDKLKSYRSAPDMQWWTPQAHDYVKQLDNEMSKGQLAKHGISYRINPNSKQLEAYPFEVPTNQGQVDFRPFLPESFRGDEYRHLWGNPYLNQTTMQKIWAREMAHQKWQQHPLALESSSLWKEYQDMQKRMGEMTREPMPPTTTSRTSFINPETAISPDKLKENQQYFNQPYRRTFNATGIGPVRYSNAEYYKLVNQSVESAYDNLAQKFKINKFDDNGNLTEQYQHLKEDFEPELLPAQGDPTKLPLIVAGFRPSESLRKIQARQFGDWRFTKDNEGQETVVPSYELVHNKYRDPSGQPRITSSYQKTDMNNWSYPTDALYDPRKQAIFYSLFRRGLGNKENPYPGNLKPGLPISDRINPNGNDWSTFEDALVRNMARDNVDINALARSSGESALGSVFGQVVGRELPRVASPLMPNLNKSYKSKSLKQLLEDEQLDRGQKLQDALGSLGLTFKPMEHLSYRTNQGEPIGISPADVGFTMADIFSGGTGGSLMKHLVPKGKALYGLGRIGESLATNALPKVVYESTGNPVLSTATGLAAPFATRGLAHRFIPKSMWSKSLAEFEKSPVFKQVIEAQGKLQELSAAREAAEASFRDLKEGSSLEKLNKAIAEEANQRNLVEEILKSPKHLDALKTLEALKGINTASAPSQSFFQSMFHTSPEAKQQALEAARAYPKLNRYSRLMESAVSPFSTLGHAADWLAAKNIPVLSSKPITKSLKGIGSTLEYLSGGKLFGALPKSVREYQFNLFNEIKRLEGLGTPEALAQANMLKQKSLMRHFGGLGSRFAANAVAPLSVWAGTHALVGKELDPWGYVDPTAGRSENSLANFYLNQFKTPAQLLETATIPVEKPLNKLLDKIRNFNIQKPIVGVKHVLNAAQQPLTQLAKNITERPILSAQGALLKQDTPFELANGMLHPGDIENYRSWIDQDPIHRLTKDIDLFDPKNEDILRKVKYLLDHSNGQYEGLQRTNDKIIDDLNRGIRSHEIYRPAKFGGGQHELNTVFTKLNNNLIADLPPLSDQDRQHVIDIITKTRQQHANINSNINTVKSDVPSFKVPQNLPNTAEQLTEPDVIPSMEAHPKTQLPPNTVPSNTIPPNIVPPNTVPQTPEMSPQSNQQGVVKIQQDPQFQAFAKQNNVPPESVPEFASKVWHNLGPWRWALLGGLSLAAISVLAKLTNSDEDSGANALGGLTLPALALGGLGGAAHYATGGEYSKLLQPEFYDKLLKRE